MVSKRITVTTYPEHKTTAEMLAEFHGMMAHPETNLLWLRDDLHREEANELSEALYVLDAASSQITTDKAREMVARELADLVYVCYGTAHGLHIDLDVALREVHRANMAKAGGPRRDDGKLLKPEGWQPPDMSEAVKQEVCKACRDGGSRHADNCPDS